MKKGRSERLTYREVLTNLQWHWCREKFRGTSTLPYSCFRVIPISSSTSFSFFPVHFCVVDIRLILLLTRAILLLFYEAEVLKMMCVKLLCEDFNQRFTCLVNI